MNHPNPDELVEQLVELINKHPSWLIEPEMLTWHGGKLIDVREGAFLNPVMLQLLHPKIEVAYRAIGSNLAVAWKAVVNDELRPDPDQTTLLWGLRHHHMVYYDRTGNPEEAKYLDVIVDVITLRVLRALYAPVTGTAVHW